jgi:hypothetical protein
VTYCNSISKTGTHSCELEKDHDGPCRAESFRGGYVFWRPAPPAPRGEQISVHVPPENLIPYRRIMNLARHVDSIGNTRSNRGDYAGANAAWTRAERISREAQKLRVPGKGGK